MTREIIFRGKRVDNGQWVEGGLTINETAKAYRIVIGFGLTGDLADDNHVCFGEFHLVDPSTIGQFTGLKDKNGQEVYEGDIVECWDDSADELDRRHTGVIEYASPSFSLAVKTRFPNSISRTASRHEIDGSYPNMKTYLDRWVNAENIEVVGNIHDNPDLINQDEVNDDNEVLFDELDKADFDAIEKLVNVGFTPRWFMPEDIEMELDLTGHYAKEAGE